MIESSLETLPVEPTAADRRDLVALLIGCVRAGASIGFTQAITEAEAEWFWRTVFDALPGGHRVVLVIREPAAGEGEEGAGRIVASAQLVFASMPNSRHRAEVQKVMVLPSHRRRGLAARLMREIEARAQARGVWLLFLDTSDSHAGAGELYESLGYVYVGGIPGYALDTHGRPEKNAIYYKTLAPGG